jgi:hypothetical protein
MATAALPINRYTQSHGGGDGWWWSVLVGLTSVKRAAGRLTLKKRKTAADFQRASRGHPLGLIFPGPGKSIAIG